MLSDYGKGGTQPAMRMPEPMPAPMEPGSGSSGIWKGCLVAGGIFLVLAVLVLGIGGYYVYRNSGKFTAMLFEKGKPQILGYLTEENTEEDRANYEAAYDAMVGEIKKDGIIKFATEHEKSYQTLQAIIADQKVSPDEVYLWIEEWNREMGVPESLDQGEIQEDVVPAAEGNNEPLVEPETTHPELEDVPFEAPEENPLRHQEETPTEYQE